MKGASVKDMRRSTRGPGGGSVAGGAARGPAPLAELRRRVVLLTAWTRAVVWLEAAFWLLWPVIAALAAYLGLAAAGVWEILPAWAAVAAFAGLLVFAPVLVWRRGRRLGPRIARAAVIERLAGGDASKAAAVAALFDTPATGQAALWRLHLERAASLCRRLAPPSPRLVLPAQARAGGALGLLLLLTGLALGRAHAPARITAALPPPLLREPAEVALAAVLVPPAYTRQPARAVIDGRTGPHPVLRALDSVPEGSRLEVTLEGGVSPPVIIGPKGKARLASAGPGRFSGAAVLTRPGRWEIRQGRRTRLALDVRLRADRPPTLHFAGTPQAGRLGTLTLKLTGEDDYGLTEGVVSFYRDEKALTAGRAFLELPLQPADGPGRQELTVQADLAARPEAGLTALVSAQIRDAAGQKAGAGPLRLRLPERAFTNPVAAAVARLRRTLLRRPDEAPLVAAGLHAIKENHAAFAAHKTAYLALAAAVWRLKLVPAAGRDPALARLLWQVALDLEDAGVSLAAEDMRKALDRLAAALSGAGDLNAAMAAAEQAVSQFLARLALEQLKAAASVPLADLAGLMQTRRALAKGQISSLFDEIRALIRAGREQEAAARFAQLKALLDRAAAQPMTAQDIRRAARLRRALKDLGRLSNAQASLHDRTVETALLSSLMAERGFSFDPTPLRREQEDLRTRLEGILSALKEAGLAPPAMLPKAAPAMDEAARALDRRAPGRASVHQLDALSAIDAALEALRRQAEASAASGAVVPGLADPMGRPAGGMDNSDLALPDGLARRQIDGLIEAVRRRLADPGMDADGRRYLERLLETY